MKPYTRTELDSLAMSLGGRFCDPHVDVSGESIILPAEEVRRLVGSVRQMLPVYDGAKAAARSVAADREYALRELVIDTWRAIEREKDPS